MPSARNGSIVVHYDVRGTGPAAILFNHSGTSSLAWSERFLEAMAEHLGVVTVDHRGTGQSSAVSGGPLSMAELASDALAALEQEGIESAVVIGTSMGGAVAQEFALAYPRYVSTLVLLGTFAGNAQLVPPEPAVVDVMREASGTKSTIARWRRILSVTYSAKFLAQHEDVALELELKGARFTTDETIASHADAVSRFEAYDRLPAISASTLVVHGTDDLLIPFENGEILAKRIPGAEFVRREGVGHLPAVEEPMETAERILDFARRNGVLAGQSRP